MFCAVKITASWMHDEEGKRLFFQAKNSDQSLNVPSSFFLCVSVVVAVYTRFFWQITCSFLHCSGKYTTNGEIIANGKSSSQETRRGVANESLFLVCTRHIPHHAVLLDSHTIRERERVAHKHDCLLTHYIQSVEVRYYSMCFFSKKNCYRSNSKTL